MKNLFLLFLFVGIVASVHAQKGYAYEDDAFHSIYVSNSFEVILTQADEYAVDVDAAPGQADKIEVFVDRGVLHVRMKKNYWQKKSNSNSTVHITFPEIRSMKFSGAVTARNTNRIEANDLELHLSGASRVDLELECDQVDIHGSGASDIKLDMEADDVYLNLSGASKVYISGEGDDFHVKCSGASHIKAADFHTDSVNLESSGAKKRHSQLGCKCLSQKV